MKALIPAAGLGARLQPLTNTIPKELLPVAGRPAIQWVVEESFRAGIREFVIVISDRKTAIRRYLTPLDENGRMRPEMAGFEVLLKSIDIEFVAQPQPRGLGDALLHCRHSVGNEPFVLALPDNVFTVDSEVISRLIRFHEAMGKSCLALREVDSGDSDGPVIARLIGRDRYMISSVLSKGNTSSESRLRPVGRAVLEPEVFGFLEGAATGGQLDDVPGLDGLARSNALYGLLVRDQFVHLGAEANRADYASTMFQESA